MVRITEAIYDALWYLGSISGCHQRPDRSFFVRGKQFPVCARCTGAFIGYTLGAITLPLFHINLIVCGIFCLIMFVDWLIQRIGILQSNNLRRLLTGILCGFGLIRLYFALLLHVEEIITGYWG